MKRSRLIVAGIRGLPVSLALLVVVLGLHARTAGAAEDARVDALKPDLPDGIAASTAPPGQNAEVGRSEARIGWTLSLPDVLFASGRWQIDERIASELDALARFLVRHPHRFVAIEGHADRVGRTATNRVLSWRRAEAVKDHLLGRGVAASRITASARGSDLPVADNASFSGRQQNRRVAITVFE